MNERSSHIAVLDQTIGIGNPALLREPDRGWNPRIGYTNHQVRIHSGLTGQCAPDALAIAVERFTEKSAVGTSEINHLEHAEAVRFFTPAFPPQLRRSEFELHELTRLNIIDVLRTDDFQTAGFTADHPLTSLLLTKKPENQRTDAMAIADREQALRRPDHKAEGSLAEIQGGLNSRFPTEAAIHSLLNGEGNQFGIGGGGEFHLAVVHGPTQIGGIDQVAVVGKREGTKPGHQDDGLGIADLAAAGC